MGRPRGASFGKTAGGKQAVELTTHMDLSGPFFTRDPAKTVRENIRDMLGRLAEEMEKDVQGQIEARAGSTPAYTGWSRSRVVGRTASLVGRNWWLHAVVSPNTTGLDKANAIRTMAATATIERRWHPFRKTSFRVRHSRAVLGANLTKGID